MSLFLDNFKDFLFYPHELRKNIKFLRVFQDNISYFVTDSDKVYALGLSVGEYNEQNCVLIEKLCDKNIEDFFGNDKQFFAKSQTNRIYSWCNRNSNSISLELIKIDFFDDKDIIEICCGAYHCLALSSDGSLWVGW